MGEIVRAKLEKAALEPQETTEILLTINERKMLFREYEGELQIIKEEKILVSFPIRVRPSTATTTAPMPQEKAQQEPARVGQEEENNSIVPIVIMLLLIAAIATFWYIKNRPQDKKYQGFIPKTR